MKNSPGRRFALRARSAAGGILLILLLTAAPDAFSAAVPDAAPPGEAKTPELARLIEKLQPMARNRTLRAHYRQIRRFRELDYSMEIVGSVTLERGRRFAWRTETPLRSVCLFDRETLRMWDEETGRIQTLAMADLPWLRSIFQSQELWLSGRIEPLFRTYRMEPVDERTLRVRPVAGGGAPKVFSELRIRFNRAFSAVEFMELCEPNGDTMTFFFDRVENNPEIPESEWKLSPEK